jgi:hypothetical protein
VSHPSSVKGQNDRLWKVILTQHKVIQGESKQISKQLKEKIKIGKSVLTKSRSIELDLSGIYGSSVAFAEGNEIASIKIRLFLAGVV